MESAEIFSFSERSFPKHNSLQTSKKFSKHAHGNKDLCQVSNINDAARCWCMRTTKTGVKMSNFSEMFSIEKHLRNKLKA